MILQQNGKLEEAIGLYMKSGRLVQLTKLIVDHFSTNSDQNQIISKDLVDKIIIDLERAEAYEEAGDLYQLPIIDNKQNALRSFTKAKAFSKAINLARVQFPDEVVTLESQYGEYLMNEMDDPSNAVNHFIEAGRTEKALEAAVMARQFDRAAEIASILDQIPTHYGKKIAEYYVQRDEIEPALEMYLNMSCVRDAVQLLNDRGQYARAFKIAKQLMSTDEAREMYEMIAKSYESNGKWKEAERIYIACGDVDAAISMYKNNREFDSMLKLVRQHHPGLLTETCIYLARELESEHLYKQAEQYYLMANEWQQAAQMYRNVSQWEDSYRVSRANGGASAAKQVAFHWAQTMSTPQEAVVDYALENNEFEFALSLIRNSSDLKHKLIDVQLKYAGWLENENLFNEAETMYVEAGKPKEAVVMYLHHNNFDDALRVATEYVQQEDEVVKDILTAQARYLFDEMKRYNDFDRIDRVESLLLRAGRIEMAVRLFRDSGLWDEAVHIAEQYAPHLLESLRRDMITSTTAHATSSTYPSISLQSSRVNSPRMMNQLDY
ncbi:Wimple/ift172-like protein, partial [Euroglyphus maynei]